MENTADANFAELYYSSCIYPRAEKNDNNDLGRCDNDIFNDSDIYHHHHHSCVGIFDDIMQ
jgi:hypothetical protein